LLPTPPSTAAAPSIKPEPVASTAIAEKLSDLIENKLGTFVSRKTDRSGVAAFYLERGFAPLWVGRDGPLPRARDAAAFLRGVDADGLDPSDYPVPGFANTSPDALAADELRLTDSLLTFARHARTGRVSFNRVSAAIHFDMEIPESADVLRKLSVATDVRAALDAYNPQQPGYKALKAELARERDRKAGSEDTTVVTIPNGPKLRPGMKDERVPLLRRRLSLAARDDTVYDQKLVEAITDFQDRSGLDNDGVIGANTVANLNAELKSRASKRDTILANMERWRWMPRNLGPTYVMVNVPDYTLKVVSDGKTVWSTRIVVGKPGKLATPLMTETMKFITVNPTWNVPPSIIRNEYLPALARDPYALARVGLRIGRNSDGSIRIYQPPGDRNALGRIRFNFPNRFLVYQHDTPSKNLFEKNERAFSHGCMRVQNPEEYAQVLLSLTQPEERYTSERIRRMYGSSERTIKFKTPIPVYVSYQTAFVDDGGRLQIRADIYGHDKETSVLFNSDSKAADVPMARKEPTRTKKVAKRSNRPRKTYASRRDYDGTFRDDFFFQPRVRYRDPFSIR
jgi:murein L,D-transpeptidase YcbB/YkuD